MVDQQYDTLFLGYIEGDLTPEQIQEFENMLVQDARLRNLVAQLVIDRSRLRRLPKEDAPTELMERVNQQIERRMLLNGSLNSTPTTGMSPEHRFRLNRYMAYAGVAAMVAITATAVILTLNNPMPDLTKKPSRLPALAQSPTKIEGQQLADARSSRDTPGDLLGGRQLEDIEPRLREIAKPTTPLPPAAPRATGSQSELFGTVAQKEKPKADSSQMGLAEPPPTAAPQVRDHGAIFSEDKKESAAAAPAPTAEVANQGGKPEEQATLTDKVHPLPALPPGSAMFYEVSGVRLEVASPWPDVSRREVIAWANRHGAHVVTEEELDKTKRLGETEPDRAVLLVVANKQVPDLVAFLETQKGQTAKLTRVVAPQDFAGLAAHGQRTEWANPNEPAARGERAATQPTTSPAQANALKNAVVEAKINEPQEQVKRVKVPVETVVLPNAPDAVMKLEVIIEPRGVDR